MDVNEGRKERKKVEASSCAQNGGNVIELT